ncbi:MAG: hypothetical protein OEO79_17310 [Gemmatimonadota bacterium]|nr:hypothetical protein [Gemmatimonadota bacterium]MDH3421984.1 hypothetical protein [Gemmatimonadota bacterium]
MSSRRSGGRLLFFGVLAIVGACDLRQPAEDPALVGGPAPSTLWHSLGEWSGRGSRQTESFDVSTGSLRLSWETTNESPPSGGHFSVTIHSAISGRPLESIVDVRGMAADTVQFGVGPRVAYLRIESDGVDWRVSLQEGASGNTDAESARE